MLSQPHFRREYYKQLFQGTVIHNFIDIGERNMKKIWGQEVSIVNHRQQSLKDFNGHKWYA